MTFVLVCDSVHQFISSELIVTDEFPDVRLQFWQRATAIVLLLALAILVDEERGIALDLLVYADLFVLRRCAVNLGKHNAQVGGLRLCRQLLPGGLQLLAMSTPGCIEFDKGNAIAGCLLEFLVAVQLQHILLFSLRRCLFGRILEIVSAAWGTDHLYHIGFQCGQVACTRIFLNLFAILYPEQCGIALDLKVLAYAAILCAIDFRYRCLRLLDQLLGQLLPRGRQTLRLIQACHLCLNRRWIYEFIYLTMAAPGRKEFDKVIATGHMLGERLLGEINDLAHVGIRSAAIQMLLLLLQILLGGRVQLLIDEIRNGWQVACTLKLDRLLFALLEESQRGVASHLVIGAERLMLGAVHLGNGHLRLIYVHYFSQLLPQWMQALAMAAPAND